MGFAGGISRTFLYALNKTESPGLDRFLEVLEERRDVQKRTRGLLTGEPGKVTLDLDECSHRPSI